MVKVLDTVVKAKVYESKEEELCVSFGLLFVCSTQIIGYAKIDNPHFSKRLNLKVYLNQRDKKQKGRYQDRLKETEVKGQAKCCSYLLNKKLYYFRKEKGIKATRSSVKIK